MSVTITAADRATTLPSERAAELAGITMRQLRYWEAQGLIVPSIRQKLGRRDVRLYAFSELLELLVAAQLRKRVSLQHLRAVIDHLRTRGYEAPLRQLHFAALGNEVLFELPDGTWEGGRRPGQSVIRETIDFGPLVARLQGAKKRSEHQLGVVVRRRLVLGSKPVFAGTRIRVDTVLSYLRNGYTEQQILDALPSLRAEDIEEARQVGAA